MGSPKGCEPYGDRVPVVVAEVTTCQEGGKAVHRAKGHR
jgi:Na+-translocating ferredoxin:NAD+ oxidoreductase RNF subunit RnfB